MPIRGDQLPDGTLSFTYDDGPGSTPGGGPGPRTLELARYLSERGVPATFFVIGASARAAPGTLAELRALGHLVANHTERHQNLLSMVEARADAIGELEATDRLLREALNPDFTVFRPPYGAWSVPRSVPCTVAQRLNASKTLGRCIGPILWDVNGDDWRYWAERASAIDCAARYLSRIEAARRGIVLFHDSSFEGPIRSGNRGLELARLIVPSLQRRGFRFVRVDEVPQVASAIAVSQRIALRAAGRTDYVSAPQSYDGALSVRRTVVGATEEFGVVPVGGGKLALRAPSGRYLRVGPAGDETVFASAPTLDAASIFTRIDLDDGNVALRESAGGRALSAKGSELRAVGPDVGPTERFALIPY